MLINWLNNTPDLNIPDTASNMKVWTTITDIFLIDPDFTFNTEADFINETVWLNGIGNGYIIPIHNIIESDPVTEDTVYNVTIHDYEYKSRDGKIRLIFKLNPDITWHQDLINYSGQYYKVCFADRSRKIYGILSGSQVLGIDTDMISIEQPKFGALPAWTIIKIELSSIDDIYEVDSGFIPRDLKNIPVTVQNVTQSVSTDITFQVIDSVCSVEIEGLVSSDVVVIDGVSGTISHSTFTDSGDGYYTITSGSTIYNGTITVFNTSYNGNGVYSFTVPTFNPSNFSSNFNLT